jgi:hypothetical protein
MPGEREMRADRLDREGRPAPKVTVPVKNFRIVLDAIGQGEITTRVPREILLEAIDDYVAKGRKVIVVPE